MSRLMSLAIAAVLSGGLSGAATAEVWPSLLPTSCADVRHNSVDEPISTLLEPLSFSSAADLRLAADRQARASGQPIGDALWLVARTAAAVAADRAVVTQVLDYLRSLWIGGETRAALIYGQLASRWPDVNVSPTAGQALASAAVTGNPEAMLSLARIKAASDPDDRSVAGLVMQARSLLWSKVTGGQCQALMTLARLALDPIAETRSPSEAADLLSAAADRRVADAAAGLATLLTSGDGIAYDLPRALALLQKESRRGTHSAMLMLARLSLAGPLPARDPRRGEQLAGELASGSSPEARAAAMLLAENAAGRFGGEVDRKRVTDLLTTVEGAKGDSGWDLLARAYLEGWSGSIDVLAGERALAKAAQGNNTDALAQLAELHLSRDGANSEAVALLREAAENGSVTAMLRIRGLAAAGTIQAPATERVRKLLVDAAAEGSDQAALAVAQDLFRDAIVGDGARPEDEQGLIAGARKGSVVAALEVERARELGLIDSAAGVPELNRAAAVDANGAPARLLRIGRAYDGQTSMGEMPETAADYLRKCAELGDVRCHAALAALSADYPTLNLATEDVAARSRLIAANAGQAGAMLAAAEAGTGPSDVLLKRSAELNYLPAMFVMLSESRGHPDRYAEAIRWFDRAVALAAVDIEQGVALGRAYRDGGKLPKDPELALATFLKSATLGSSVAMREVANLQLAYTLPEVRSSGLAWLQRAASLGDVASMERLSRAYFDGWFGAADAKAGFRMARLAAARGSSSSKRIVAEALETGFGTPVDLATAKRWRRDSADAGDVEAMVSLGESALSEGPQHDEAQALAWFRRAAARGDDRALFRLGQLQEQGRLGAPDEAAAGALYKAAAARGNLLSIYTLSRLRDKTHPAPIDRRRPTRTVN